MRKFQRVAATVGAIALTLGACAGGASDEGSSDVVDDVADDTTGEADDDGEGSATATEDGSTATTLDVEDWDSVLEEARGTTVNFHMWGGSENINGYVTDILGEFVAEEYGVTLNLVPVGDTVDAVNTVLNELQAGVNEDGSVDMVWINGANYFTMNQADALLTEWERVIPNSSLVDWESEKINTDFGFPVEGMSPWTSTFFQLVYDSDRIDEADVPRTYDELRTWILDNPGRFTYPELPVFHGTRFVQTVLYETTGGHEQWRDTDADTFLADSRPAWEYLKEIEDSLWQQGQSYPNDIAQLNQLFANGEVDFTISFTPSGIKGLVDSGELPESARPFVLENSAASDANYLAVPVNAANPAGALVVANAALDPAMQLGILDPEAAGWGDGVVIQTDRIDEEAQAEYQQVADNIAPYGLAPEVLAAEEVPHPSPEIVTEIEQAWDTYIRQGQPLP